MSFLHSRFLSSPLRKYFQQCVQSSSIPVHSPMTLTYTSSLPKVITSSQGLTATCVPLSFPACHRHRDGKDIQRKNDESKLGLVTYKCESGPRMMPVRGTFENYVNWKSLRPQILLCNPSFEGGGIPEPAAFGAPVLSIISSRRTGIIGMA